MIILWLFRVKKGIDQTTQLCGDFNMILISHCIEGSLLNNQNSIESIRPFFFRGSGEVRKGCLTVQCQWWDRR